MNPYGSSRGLSGGPSGGLSGGLSGGPLPGGALPPPMSLSGAH